MCQSCRRPCCRYPAGYRALKFENAPLGERTGSDPLADDPRIVESAGVLARSIPSVDMNPGLLEKLWGLGSFSIPPQLSFVSSACVLNLFITGFHSVRSPALLGMSWIFLVCHCVRMRHAECKIFFHFFGVDILRCNVRATRPRLRSRDDVGIFRACVAVAVVYSLFADDVYNTTLAFRKRLDGISL